MEIKTDYETKKKAFAEKYGSYKKAIERLTEALYDYLSTSLDDWDDYLFDYFSDVAETSEDAEKYMDELANEINELIDMKLEPYKEFIKNDLESRYSNEEDIIDDIKCWEISGNIDCDIDLMKFDNYIIGLKADILESVWKDIKIHVLARAKVDKERRRLKRSLAQG